MKRLVLATLAVVALAGCAHDAVRSAPAGNGVTVGVLFEHEGVRVYRFLDGGVYHYYAVPMSGLPAASFSQWTETCGKNCTHTVVDEVQTMARR